MHRVVHTMGPTYVANEASSNVQAELARPSLPERPTYAADKSTVARLLEFP